MFLDRWRGRDGRTSVKVCGDRIRGWSTKNEEDGILRMTHVLTIQSIEYHREN